LNYNTVLSSLPTAGLHYLVAKPLSLLLGPGPHKYMVFLLLRLIFGSISAVCELRLYRAVRRFGMAEASSYLLAFLLCSTGMFSSATTFLPSTMAMWAMTWAAAHVIEAAAAEGEAQEGVAAAGEGGRNKGRGILYHVSLKRKNK
jgi:hypothetical protein